MNFLWNKQLIMVTAVDESDIRKARKPNNRKQQQTDKKEVHEVGDPLQAADPWKNAVVKTVTPSSVPSSSTMARTVQPDTQAPSAVSSADPRVTALAQRVEKLEGETRELHTKMDTVDSKVDNMGVSMTTQFTEVLRLLGSINERKRGPPEAGS